MSRKGVESARSLTEAHMNRLARLVGAVVAALLAIVGFLMLPGIC